MTRKGATSAAADAALGAAAVAAAALADDADEGFAHEAATGAGAGAGAGGAAAGTSGAGAGAVPLGASASSLALTAPRIIRHADGVSSIVIPASSSSSAKKDAEAEAANSSNPRAAEIARNTAANAAAVARLRSIPDYGIVGHYEPILALALSSDGRYLASGGGDRFVRLWDPHAFVGKAAQAQAQAQKQGSRQAAAAGGAGTSSAASSAAAAGSAGGAASSAAAAVDAATGGGVTAGGSGLSGALGLGIGPGVNVDSFVGHKDAVTALTFRRGTHTLYSGSADRCVKIWECGELSYSDTLYGHQADITAIAATGKDRPVTAGRDRTLRLWKVPEQSQLIFRCHGSDVSTDALAIVNDSWIVSGGADGSLSLWHTSKKKPVYTRYRAHGAASAPAAGAGAGAADADADADALAPSSLLAAPENTCWISAVAHCPSSDVIASGSGDGFIRLWRLVTEAELSASASAAGDDDDEDESSEGEGGEADTPEARKAKETRRRGRRLLRLVNLSGVEANRASAFRGLVALGAIPCPGMVNGLAFSADGRLLVAAVGQEHRLGAWYKNRAARNGVVFIRMPDVPRRPDAVAARR